MSLELPVAMGLLNVRKTHLIFDSHLTEFLLYRAQAPQVFLANRIGRTLRLTNALDAVLEALQQHFPV